MKQPIKKTIIKESDLIRKSPKKSSKLLAGLKSPSGLIDVDKKVIFQIKHISKNEFPFTEEGNIYNLIITDYDDKYYRVLKYINAKGEVRLFCSKKLLPSSLGQEKTTICFSEGLISKKIVEFLMICNL